jgi:fructose-specific phosphotransferase system IIC component
MIKQLEKYWPYISILLILAIVASLFYWKSATQLLSIILIGVSVVAVLIFVIQKQIQAQKQGKISLTVMRRNILVDVLGVLISMAAVILVAGKVAGVIVQPIGNVLGGTAGILCALVAGLVAGIGINLVVQWVWRSLTKPRKIFVAKKGV